MAQLPYNYTYINPSKANTLQKVVLTFLYYVGSVDPTIIVSLNSIVAE